MKPRDRDSDPIEVRTKAPTPTDPMAEQPLTPKRQTRSSSGRGKILTMDRGRPRIRYQIPSVARYLARVIVQHAMDYELAIESIAGGEMDETSIREIANNMKDSAEVQAAIENELTIHGLDEKSKDAFVHEMWDWLRGPSEELAKKAAGILGRGFIAERISTDKPEQLPIEGIEDAVNSMLGTPSKEKSHDLTDAPKVVN